MSAVEDKVQRAIYAVRFDRSADDATYKPYGVIPDRITTAPDFQEPQVLFIHSFDESALSPAVMLSISDSKLLLAPPMLSCSQVGASRATLALKESR